MISTTATHSMIVFYTIFSIPAITTTAGTTVGTATTMT
jgi:hypothetical protein